jgi:hypothetical protein
MEVVSGLGFRVYIPAMDLSNSLNLVKQEIENRKSMI